jgi:translation initiation factor 2 subunit 3
LGHPGKLPEIFVKIEVKCHLLRRLLGVRQRRDNRSMETVGEIRKTETLLVNVGSTAVGARVTNVSGSNSDQITFELLNPVCSEIGEKIAISRRIDKCWR